MSVVVRDLALKVKIEIGRKMAIQRHVFWGQWKSDKGLNNTIYQC